jgi:hypothetical protein
MIKRYFTRLKRRIEVSRGADLVASEQHANDFYLVEYPKSGITWLSVLLTNTFLSNEGSKHHATFSSVRCYIPDLHVTKTAHAHNFNSPNVRVYKSHSLFHPNYVNIIYLVRHPIAVMHSHYRFRKNLGQYKGSFDDFCFRSEYGVEGWRRHINSWLVYPHNTNQRFIHLIRYEDLVADTVGEIREITRNFGWGLEAGVLEKAANLSDRTAMRDQEAFYRSRNPAHNMEFISAGKYSEISEETTRRIEMQCALELQLLGYSSRVEA